MIQVRSVWHWTLCERAKVTIKYTVNSIEVPYRLGLKHALSIHETINTKIIYIETGRLPLSIRTSKQQLKFWIDFLSYLTNDPQYPLACIIEGQQLILPYLRYYSNLEISYVTPEACQRAFAKDVLEIPTGGRYSWIPTRTLTRD